MRAIIIVIFLFCIVSAVFAGVNRDSLQAAIADSLRNKLFRGEILIHFPLVVFPLDSASGDVTWIPVPEMGFRFTPTIGFRGGWFAFPIRVMGMFPFADDYAALGDASIGCEVYVPPYHAGVHYRLMRGKIYPVRGNFIGHIAGVDLGIPVSGLGGSGVSIDWVFYTKLELGRTFQQSGVNWDSYKGNTLTVAPYWSFTPGGYGELTLAYRFTILQSFEGYDDETSATYEVGKQSISLIELRYVYP
ncbi:hypothetical protein DRQ36_07030 [bacterium]|nr:MAG: hypothetical protein DRQ36_07030 [bacterium]